ncbi:hypothetical protein [Reichenbachiella sp. MALMAid0571]|uniref:hypothetical protein n=1 Tax=Reichenbachiella sp. MALMAid0571 TaxID=3143939 RepID=UPI0032DFA380
MQIIWYNSVLGEYQFGDSDEFKISQSKLDDQNSLTVLMELPLGDQNLANKVIGELNVAKEEQALVL